MNERKSILLISYCYPPVGGAGPPRLWHLSCGLARRGWHTTVLTVKEVSHPYPDEILENELPTNLRIVRTESGDPLRILRRLRRRKRDPGTRDAAGRGISSKRGGELFRRVVIFISFPDTRHGWIRPAFHEALELIRESPPDIMLSSSPPASAHVVAQRLVKESGLPWVADLRDPMLHFLYPSQYPTRAHRWRVAALQERILKQADAVIANTPTAASYFGKIVPERTDWIVPITNGFDPNDFCATVEPTNKFRLLHAGTLADEQQPGTFLEGLEQALNQCPEMIEHLELVFLGDVRSLARAQIEAFVSRLGKKDVVQIKPPVPHREAILEIRRAFALLLLLHSGRGCEMIVPSKLYEYIAAGRPLLAVCPPGDARGLAEEYAGGVAADFDSPKETGDQILRLFELFRSHPQVRWKDQSLLSRYTWERKVTDVEDLLDRVLHLRSGCVRKK